MAAERLKRHGRSEARPVLTAVAWLDAGGSDRLAANPSMAEFRVRVKHPGGRRTVIYEGPFGPIEIAYSKPPDLTVTLTGPNAPAATLDLGPQQRLLQRFYETREGEPYVARAGDIDVIIRNERAPVQPDARPQPAARRGDT